MSESTLSALPPLTPEHHRIAAEQFHRANQVLESGNHDYAIQLLLACCKRDPANLTYRKFLRLTQRKTAMQIRLIGRVGASIE